VVVGLAPAVAKLEAETSDLDRRAIVAEGVGENVRRVEGREVSLWVYGAAELTRVDRRVVARGSLVAGEPFRGRPVRGRTRDRRDRG
jgi:hypothetical protein